MSTHEIIPGLHLFTSNRMEILAGKLAERLEAPLPSALTPEIIVVRNKGMERWLKLELAARHGICANVEFPFPEAFGYRVFRELIPGLPPGGPVERETLLWRILAVLPELLPRPEFAPLRHYLEGEDDARKPVQLAGRIAHLFDQYLIFRPRLILAWEEGGQEVGPEAAWQPLLWRALASRLPSPHAARLWSQFHEIVSRPRLPEHALPPRLCLFGLSALPPYYLGVFAGLARHLQVNLFLLQPSQEYWGDITSPREGDRILRQQGRSDAEAFQLHLESGNRLLASLGYLGRDFLKLVLEAGDWITDESFLDPGEGTLLHGLQSDILHLRDRGAENEEPTTESRHREEGPASSALQVPAGNGRDAGAEGGQGPGVAGGSSRRTEIDSNDDSIQIQCCHSPLRELEVLHDHLLSWFDRDSTLAPRDIVVMTPDIETYAPLVTAVFGAAEDGDCSIPFSVADRAGRRQSQLIDTFLGLLDLAETRLGAARVLELLEAASLRDKFRLTDADVPAIRRWVDETHIRWGIDATHRAQFQLPALTGNTWREGLDRLLLGYSMAGQGTRTFQGILPHDDLDGTQIPVLGRWLEFLDRLFDTVADLQRARPLSDWVPRLHRVLDEFFAASEASAYEQQILRDALRDLATAQAGAGFARPLPLVVVRDRLGAALEEDIQQTGFLTGAVTFCGLKPMRSIPFRIVCLVGMNDGAFPRPTYHLGFDLMAKQPLLGDRSTREDDRYLFLETLLSARERLYLSYVGQSIRDNSDAPPSVLISELLDCIGPGFVLRGGTSLPKHLLVRHRLQAFSEEYFQPGGRLFSYSRENCRASDTVRENRNAPSPFCAGPLDEPEARFRELTLDRLAQFLINPARFFLSQRLGIQLPEETAELEEREPFTLGPLEEHRLKQEWVQACVQPEPPDQPLWLRASGRLPLGAVGESELRSLTAAAQHFLNLLQQHRRPQRPPLLDLDLTIETFQLRGRIVEFTARGPLYYRCARLKPRDMLQAWVLHLAANCVQPGPQTTLITEDGIRHYAPPEDPFSHLRDLLELYWQGLQAPLKFFPGSALALVNARRRPRRGSAAPMSSEQALQIARGHWEGSDYTGRGEQMNPHFALCFREVDPIDEEFAVLAQRVFEPILSHERLEEP